MLTTPALAAQHALDLQAAADASRLARLATCCRRGALRVAASAVGRFFDRGRLSVRQACCPWPV